VSLSWMRVIDNVWVVIFRGCWLVCSRSSRSVPRCRSRSKRPGRYSLSARSASAKEGSAHAESLVGWMIRAWWRGRSSDHSVFCGLPLDVCDLYGGNPFCDSLMSRVWMVPALLHYLYVTSPTVLAIVCNLGIAIDGDQDEQNSPGPAFKHF
jgi:hypothetical protein